MASKKRNFSRRDFIKTAGSAGLGSVLLPLSSLAQESTSTQMTEQTIVPKRPFGKTGDDVSILSLGGVLKMSDQLVFRQAFKMGITYWDTADSYGWGKNEKAIGKYFGKFPDHRKKVFLVTKAKSTDPNELTEKLNTSLERMNTSYIDLYFIHYVKSVETELTKEVKAWAEKAKEKGKIRFFGFSTHKNMENCLLAAAKLGWIDGIMMTYNYRLMVKDKMKRAVDACVKAGIGLTAMKTQAAFSANFYSSIGSETDDSLKLTDHFLKKGYTAEQAKLKAVWENPNIASICSAMPNMTILRANVAAALNNNQLSMGDKQRLKQYAQQTAPGYCAGCANICEPAINSEVPICNVMRFLMYARCYGELEVAKSYFNELPAKIRQRITHINYKKAELKCPQRMDIGRLMREATTELV
jgi:predicted aldo/keto reductase-like oxidoreductase